MAGLASQNDFNERIMNAIKLNSVDQFKMVFNSVQNSRNFKFMLFDDNDNYSDKTREQLELSIYKIRSIFHLSLLYSAYDICRYLVDEQCDIFCTEGRGFNIIHYLAIVSYYKKQFEPQAVKIYNFLLDVLSANQIAELLKMEDDDGLRPLELSIHLGKLY